MDIKLLCENALIKPEGRHYFNVELSVDEREFFDGIGMDAFVDYFNDDKILEHIGVDRVKEYFDLKSNDDE